MRFTDSPYEKMMQEIPRPSRPELQKAPAGTPCRDCPYWQGIACMGTCYKELIAVRTERGTSGHFVQKCRCG